VIEKNSKECLKKIKVGEGLKPSPLFHGLTDLELPVFFGFGNDFFGVFND
jgi:hypothetical protein